MTIALSAVPPLVAAVAAARAEAGPSAATWGKRREHVMVVRTPLSGAVPGLDPTGARIPMRRALLRNALKIAAPWQLGHIVAIGAAHGGFEDGDRVTMASPALTYVVIGVGLVTVLIRPGNCVHDRAAGTRVIASGAAVPRS